MFDQSNQAMNGSLLNCGDPAGSESGQVITSPLDQSDFMKLGGFDTLTPDLVSPLAQTDSGVQSLPSNISNSQGADLTDLSNIQKIHGVSTTSVAPQSPPMDSFVGFDPLHQESPLTQPDLTNLVNPTVASPPAADLLQQFLPMDDKPLDKLSGPKIEDFGIYNLHESDQVVSGLDTATALEEIGVYGAPPPPPPTEAMEVDSADQHPPPDLIPGMEPVGTLADMGVLGAPPPVEPQKSDAEKMLEDMGITGAPPPVAPQVVKKGGVDSKKVMEELAAMDAPAPIAPAPVPVANKPVLEQSAPSQPMQAFGASDKPPAVSSHSNQPAKQADDMSLLDLDTTPGNDAPPAVSPASHLPANPAHPFAQPFSDLLMTDRSNQEKPSEAAAPPACAEPIPLKPVEVNSITAASAQPIQEEPAAVNGFVAAHVDTAAPAPTESKPQQSVPPLDLTEIKAESEQKTSPTTKAASPKKATSSPPKSPLKKGTSTPKSPKDTPLKSPKEKAPLKSPKEKAPGKPTTPRSATNRSTEAHTKIPSPKKEKPVSAAARKTTTPRQAVEKKTSTEAKKTTPRAAVEAKKSTPRTTPRSAKVTPRKGEECWDVV